MRCANCGVESRETYEDEGIFDENLPSEDSFIYNGDWDAFICEECAAHIK